MPSFFPLLFLVMIACWSFGHGSWCSLSSPFYLFLMASIALLVSRSWFLVLIVVTFFFIFIVEIALLVSWLWFLMFITITFFFAPFSHGHLIDLMVWFLTFITIVFLYVFPNHDHFVGLLVMFIGVGPSYMFFVVVITLLFFWL